MIDSKSFACTDLGGGDNIILGSGEERGDSVCGRCEKRSQGTQVVCCLYNKHNYSILGGASNLRVRMGILRAEPAAGDLNWG